MNFNQSDAYYMLPESQRETLCRKLLNEFGATKIQRGSDGELIHSCPLPFGLHKHGDRNPSASLNYKKLVFHCFGCGSGGSLLWFIGVCRGVSTQNARGWLVNESGIEGDNLGSLLEFFDAVYTPKGETKEPIPSYSIKVLDPWKFIHPYVTEVRKIPLETVMKFQIGWDKEKNRIVIPLFWRGNLVGWQSRRLINDGTAKYIFSTGYPRKQTIMNYDATRDALIVESPFSVLSKWKDYPVIEATFGASVTKQQLRLLSKHSKVTLFMDNDEAGWKATEFMGEELSKYSDVRVVDNPFAADAADLDIDTFNNLIEEAIPYEIWDRPKKVLEWGNDVV
jgi:DNA primase